jgi:hypothetical protein
MADVIDTREAVRCLDIYTDDLISLALLARSTTLQDTTDQDMREIHEGLKTAIEEKQKEAMWLAYEIVSGTDRRRAGSNSDFHGVNAAVQRCVQAADQANAALRPPQESFAEGMMRIHREAAAREKSAKEAQEVKAKDVNPTPPVNDTMAVSPEAAAGEASF